jgi:hypothetical protein
MQARAVRVLLALLILMQSVSTFAAVPLPSAGSPDAAHLLNIGRSSGIPMEMRVESVSTPCHGDSVSLASNSAENCCDSMEYAECMLACYPMATAISSSPDLDGSPVHFRHKVDQVYTSPQKFPSGLFRPPRSS